LRACDAAKAEFTSASGNRRQFRLGIMPTLAAADIEAAIAGLREHCPELEIHIWEGNPERLAGWLKQGRIDVSWTQVGELEHGVDVLWQEPVVGLVAPGHPITRRQHPSLTIDDLRHEPFVWRQSCEIVASAREALNAAGVRLRVAARADREDVAMRLVAMNVGVAIAPRSLAVAGVTAVPLSGLRLGRTVGLRWAEGAEPGVRQDLLRVVLSLRASPLPATGPAGAVMPAGQVAASRRIRGRAARSQPK
jgi:DNA-binding transcriptional LysR family regulator